VKSTTSSPANDPVPAGLDLPRLQKYFEAHVPETQGLLTARMIHGGRSNLTYQVSDGTLHWVVRRPPLGVLTPSAHNMEREHRVMAALQDSAVAVPRTRAYCADASVIGVPFSVVSFVDGRVLRTQEDIAGLSRQQTRDCVEALVAQLAELHAVDHEDVGLRGFGRPDGYLRRQVRRWRGQWELVATRELPGLLRLHHALESATPTDSAAVIVHGDFRVDNTILDPEDARRVLAVVDWEMSTIGDPLADVGLLLAYRDPAIEGLLHRPASASPAFPGQEALAEEYARVSGRDLTGLPFHVALAFFKIAVIAEGIHQRFRKGDTVGSGFDDVGRTVPALVRAGLVALGLDPRPDR
jgi:aminoglycoside phosphotransferase (APT) family kinase protein